MRESKYGRVRAAITAVILLAAAAVMLLSGTDAGFDGETLLVKGTFFMKKIAAGDIAGVELLDRWDIGKRSFGMETFHIRTGVFTNAEAGRYSLCAYKNTGKYVKVTASDGYVTVFNLKTEEATSELYGRIKEKIPGE